jgi:hypothetical protein
MNNTVFKDELTAVFNRHHGIEPVDMGRILYQVIHDYLEESQSITGMLDFHRGYDDAERVEIEIEMLMKKGMEASNE